MKHCVELNDVCQLDVHFGVPDIVGLVGLWTSISLGWHFVVELTIGVVTLWPLILLTPIVFLGTRWFNRKLMPKKVTL